MGYISPHIVWEQKLADTKLKDGEIWLGYISKQAANAITEQHAWVLLECYIDPAHLRQIAEYNGVSSGEVLKNNFLPDDVKVKNGDFGEILARSVIQEKHSNCFFPILRWRSKATKNATVGGIDLLGYVTSGNKPEEDRLILCEVKTRTSTDLHGVDSAYKDVKKHMITALTSELYRMQSKLLEQGRNDEAQKLARFSHPHRQPYTLHLLPCVVYEKRVWNDRFLDLLPENHCSGEYKEIEYIEVVVISVENLANWIDEVHRAAISQAG